MSETWLVTGSEGYLGFKLIELLKSHGVDTVTIDVAESQKSTSHSYRVDFGDEQVMETIFRSHPIKGIIHLAALKSVIESFEKPNEYMQNNFHNSVKLFEKAKKFGVERFIFASSAAIYSPSKSGHLTLETDPINSLSPYGKSKIFCERHFEFFSQSSIQCTSLRFFNLAGVSGGVAKPTGVVNLLTDCVINGNTFFVNSNSITGQSSLTSARDYIDVLDVARVILKTMQEKPIKNFVTYNISSSIGTTLGELIVKIQEVAGREIDLQHRETNSLEVPWMVGSNASVAAELNWQPKIALETTIQRLLGGQ